MTSHDDEKGRTPSALALNESAARGAASHMEVITSSVKAPLSRATHPPVVPSKAAASKAQEPVFRHGEVPKLTSDLLRSIEQGELSLLGILVTREHLRAAATEPERERELVARVKRASEHLNRLADLHGDLSLAAQRLQGRPQWRDLEGAADADPKSLRALVEVLGREHLGGLRTRVREAIAARFADDGFLSLREKWDVRRLCEQLGFPEAELGALIDEVRRGRTTKGLAAEIEIEPPLISRADAKAKVIRSQGELLELVESDLNVAVGDLKLAIQRDSLQLWLQVQDLAGSPAWKAADRARGYLHRAGSKTQEKELNRGAWDVIWSAGTEWIRIGGGKGAPRKVRSVAELREAIEDRGVDGLRGHVGAGVLGLWLRTKADATPAVIDATEDAEQLAASTGTDEARLLQPLWRIAWRAGVRVLKDEDTPLATTAEDIINRGDPQDLAPVAATGLLALFVEEALGRKKFAADVARRTASFAGPGAPTIAGQVVQWMLGRRSLSGVGLHIEAPTPEAIWSGVTKSSAAMLAFGEAVVSGSVSAWLDAVPNTIKADSRSEISSLRRSAPHIVAQLALNVLSDPDFVVFTSAEGAPTTFEGLSQLVERAHEHWLVLSRADVLEPLEAWCARLRTPAKLKARRAGSLYSLLCAIGDTTIRQIDGYPVGCEEGRRFGGLGADCEPQLVRLRFVAWLDAHPAPPPSTRVAWATRTLAEWAFHHATELFDDINTREKALSDVTSHFLATLWAYGYGRLLLQEGTSVANTTELVKVARGHLPVIERLFDEKMLHAWVPAGLRAALDGLTSAATGAHGALAFTGLAAPEPTPASGGPPPAALASCFASLDRGAAQWLLVRDRASLAIHAIGGRLDVYEPASAVQSVGALDGDRDAIVGLSLTRRVTGDVPLHFTVSQGDMLLSAPILPRGETPVIPVALSRDLRLSAQKELALSVDNARSSFKVMMKYRHAFPSARMNGALRAIFIGLGLGLVWALLASILWTAGTEWIIEYCGLSTVGWKTQGVLTYAMGWNTAAYVCGGIGFLWASAVSLRFLHRKLGAHDLATGWLRIGNWRAYWKQDSWGAAIVIHMLIVAAIAPYIFKQIAIPIIDATLALSRIGAALRGVTPSMGMRDGMLLGTYIFFIGVAIAWVIPSSLWRYGFKGWALASVLPGAGFLAALLG